MRSTLSKLVSGWYSSTWAHSRGQPSRGSLKGPSPIPQRQSALTITIVLVLPFQRHYSHVLVFVFPLCRRNAASWTASLNRVLRKRCADLCGSSIPTRLVRRPPPRASTPTVPGLLAPPSTINYPQLHFTFIPQLLSTPQHYHHGQRFWIQGVLHHAHGHSRCKARVC